MRELARRLVRLLRRQTVLLLSRLRDALGTGPLADEARRSAGVAGVQHDIPAQAPYVDVSFDATMGSATAGRFRWTSATAEMSLHPLRSDIGLTMLHELGHYLDVKVLGDGFTPASRSEPVLARWRSLVASSANVTALLTLHASLKPGDPLADDLKYLLSLPELFARSYSQWIIARSGDTRLRQDLRKVRWEVP